MKTIVLLFPLSPYEWSVLAHALIMRNLQFLAVWELRERKNDQRRTVFVANEKDDSPLNCIGVLHRFRDDRF